MFPSPLLLLQGREMGIKNASWSRRMKNGGTLHGPLDSFWATVDRGVKIRSWWSCPREISLGLDRDSWARWQHRSEGTGGGLLWPSPASFWYPKHRKICWHLGQIMSFFRWAVCSSGWVTDRWRENHYWRRMGYCCERAGSQTPIRPPGTARGHYDKWQKRGPRRNHTWLLGLWGRHY